MGLRRQRASDNSQMSATSTAGSKYLVANSKIRVTEPQWDKGFPTAVKILPAYDPDKKIFLPYRNSIDQGTAQLGDWRMVLPIIKWVGTDKKHKLSCILYDPAAVRAGEYDQDTNPYVIMRAAVDSASREEDSVEKLGGRKVTTSTWLMYFKGKLEQQAFSRPQMAAFMQVIFYTSRGKLAFNDDGIPRGAASGDNPQLLLVTENANQSIEAKLCAVSSTYRIDAKMSEVDKMFKYGDVTRWNKGKFMVLCNPKQEEDHLYSRVTGVEADDALLPETSKNKDGFAAYEVEFFDQLKLRAKGRKPTIFTPDLSKYESTIKDNMVDWFSEYTFRIMDNDEQAVELARAFSNKPELCEYGWREAPQYWKLEEVQAIFRNRTQGFVPGAADDEDSDTDDDDEGSLGSAGSDDDDDSPPSGTSRRRKLKADSVYGKLKADFEEEEDSDSDGDDEDKPKPRRAVKKTTVKKAVGKKGVKKVTRKKRS